MPKNYTQLTADERRTIEKMLQKHCSIREIARTLDRHPQTISREILRNRSFSCSNGIGYNSRTPNDCVHSRECNKKAICGNTCGYLGTYCRICPRCNDVCKDFVKAKCEKTRDRSPWVCNGCRLSSTCRLKKCYYRAKDAQEIATERLRESREGVSLTEDEIKQIDEIFSPRLKKGQSIHAIYSSQKDLMSCCERVIYQLVDAGRLKASNLDLPLKVRRRPRARKKTFKVDKGCRINRTYKDFKIFKSMHPGIEEVQMDTVEGPLGTRKVFLTLYWPQISFLMAYLLPYQRSYYVLKSFELLKKSLSPEKFKILFPLILTDRGTEFTNPSAIEEDLTHVFYCDPNSPFQKGAIEQEHEMIRRIVPKGKSFDHLLSSHTKLMISHITSYPRPSLGYKTPQEAFEYFFEMDPKKLFGIQRIAPEDVCLNTTLLPGMRSTVTLGELTGLTGKKNDGKKEDKKENKK